MLKRPLKIISKYGYKEKEGHFCIILIYVNKYEIIMYLDHMMFENQNNCVTLKEFTGQPCLFQKIVHRYKNSMDLKNKV